MKWIKRFRKPRTRNEIEFTPMQTYYLTHNGKRIAEVVVTSAAWSSHGHGTIEIEEKTHYMKRVTIPRW